MSMTKSDHYRAAFGALQILHVVMIIPLGLFLKGWALSVIWGWFVVPTFSLPALSIPAAIGCSLIASYLTKQVQPEDQTKTEEQRTLRSIFLTLFAPPLVVFVGWVVHHWMPA